YFNESEEQPEKKAGGSRYRYVVQGVNDLVSETEECETVESTIECIKSQAIISLFQVAVIDRGTGEVLELLKARDFLERHRD
ncbi:MAG: DNA-binding protein, partial [Balneolaceae bacterium]